MDSWSLRDLAELPVRFVLLPLFVASDALRAARFKRLRAARHRGAVHVYPGVVLLGEVAITADDVLVARLWLHEASTMASGFEGYEVCELVLRDRRVFVVDDGPHLEPVLDALALRGRIERRDGGQSGGCAWLLLTLWAIIVSPCAIIIRRVVW